METLIVENTGGVCRISLNRPERHNAFNQKLLEELVEVFKRVADDEKIRAVLLKGEGKSFSAGADLDWMKAQGEASFEDNCASGAEMVELFAAIDQCPKPVVALVHGAALGGGSGLVASVDIAVAGPKALFGFTEVRLGLVPAVICPFVVRRLGYSMARAKFMTGDRFRAEEAYRIGMVHYLAEDPERKVEELLQSILSGATASQTATKELMRKAWDLAPDEYAQETAKATAVARASTEGGEGLAAFLEKRKPNWHPEA